jgi:hypothetical protein
MLTECVFDGVNSSCLQGCRGVLDPAGVLPPGVAISVPAFLFFFFFLGIKAGGLVRAARKER